MPEERRRSARRAISIPETASHDRRAIIAVALTLLYIPAAKAQKCTRPQEPLFYEANHYTVGRIVMESPFDFFHLVQRRLEAIRGDLALKEGAPFSRSAYDESFKQVEDAVRSDSAFGKNSPLKIVLALAALENCVERAGVPNTLDVTYQVFSTDPPHNQGVVTVEDRQNSIEKPATAAGEQNTHPKLKLEPLAGYDHTYRFFAGGSLMSRIPGHVPVDFKLQGIGSPTRILLDGQLNLSLASHFTVLSTSQYHVGYHYVQMPAHDLSLAEGSFYASFSGATKTVDTHSSQIAARYGASVERGLQQSNRPVIDPPTDIIANSAFGAFRLYAGVTGTTRYSAIAASYGLEIGGTSLADPGFTKHVGDLDYNNRFPGSTHRPWDIEVRATGGAIIGNQTLLNERFFGGGAVSAFIPGDSWCIPNGPLVRSIAPNLLLAVGSGGTSFYSTNATIGKVVWNVPLIPASIENVPGFSSGVSAAEDTAQGFFADGYESASPSFQSLAVDYSKRLKAEIDSFRGVLREMQGTANMSSSLRQRIDETDREARLAQNFLRHADDRDKKGLVDAIEFKTLNDPSSRFIKLLEATQNLQPLLEEDLRLRLAALRVSLQETLSSLGIAIKAIDDGQTGRAARARAEREMMRPRESIDTLRHEANSFSLSLLGIFDTGRMWPDGYGTRYAIGGGVRLSMVNVNFNIGYAVNPDPQRQVGQGHGALFLSLTYTNLFR
jgi:hypothetical protein